MDDYRTTAEAALYCGMEYEAFRGHVKGGAVNPDIRTPRALLFKRETLDAFLATPRRGRGWQKGRPRGPRGAASGGSSSG